MSTSENIKLCCLCRAGFCRVLISGSSWNPDRTYITCPNMVSGRRGCGLWQWLDEVRMCPCNTEICKHMLSHSKANPDRWFYCCPMSNVGVKGCGFFAWKTPESKEVENKNVTKENKKSEETKLEELRNYLEMKQAITSKVCESVLEQMKKLRMG